MRKGGGSVKGGAFERNISKQLSAWVSDGERLDLFWRSGGSGSVATVSGDDDHSMVADIVPVRESARLLLSVFVVECKAVNSMRLDRPVYGYEDPFIKYWKKLRYQAFKARKLPCMVFKENRRPIVVATSRAGAQILNDGGHMEERLVYPWLNASLFLFQDLITHPYEALEDRIKRARKYRRKLK